MYYTHRIVMLCEHLFAVKPHASCVFFTLCVCVRVLWVEKPNVKHLNCCKPNHQNTKVIEGSCNQIWNFNPCLHIISFKRRLFDIQRIEHCVANIIISNVQMASISSPVIGVKTNEIMDNSRAVKRAKWHQQIELFQIKFQFANVL